MKHFALKLSIALTLGAGLAIVLLWSLGRRGTELPIAHAAELRVCPVGCTYSSYPMTQPTTLDAQRQGRVLYVTGNISSTIEGLRLTGGDAAGLGGPSGDSGGGVFVMSATVIMSHNQMFSNVATFGGALYVFNSANVALIGNTVRGNTGETHAGGLYFRNSPGATLIANVVGNNNAPAPVGHYGGVRFDNSPNATMIDNTVSTNHAADACGGVCFTSSNNAVLIGNTITNNHSGSPGFGQNAGGGGLRFVNSNGASLLGNTVTHNSTFGNGGGLYLERSNITLTNNVIADNRLVAWENFTGTGSALYVAGSSPQLLHTTIARNSGGDGNGVYVADVFGSFSSVAITNTIVVSHTVGITVASGNTATLEATLWGTGAWANTMDWGGAGTVISSTINLWEDPAFVAPDAGNYHIGPGSAALEAGVNAGVDKDIDGDQRPMGHGYDLGADELRISLLVTKHANPDPVQVGALLTYTIHITNTGDMTLTVTITDVLPASVMPTGILTWTPSPILPGGIWIDQVVVTVEQDRCLTNVVKVTTGEGATGVFRETSGVAPHCIYLPVIFRNYDPLLIEVSGILHAGDICVACCYPTFLETADKDYELALFGMGQYDGYYVRVRGILRDACELGFRPVISVISFEVLGPSP